MSFEDSTIGKHVSKLTRDLDWATENADVEVKYDDVGVPALRYWFRSPTLRSGYQAHTDAAKPTVLLIHAKSGSVICRWNGFPSRLTVVDPETHELIWQHYPTDPLRLSVGFGFCIGTTEYSASEISQCSPVHYDFRDGETDDHNDGESFVVRSGILRCQFENCGIGITLDPYGTGSILVVVHERNIGHAIDIGVSNVTAYMKIKPEHRLWPFTPSLQLPAYSIRAVGLSSLSEPPTPSSAVSILSTPLSVTIAPQHQSSAFRPVELQPSQSSHSNTFLSHHQVQPSQSSHSNTFLSHHQVQPSQSSHSNTFLSHHQVQPSLSSPNLSSFEGDENTKLSKWQTISGSQFAATLSYATETEDPAEFPNKSMEDGTLSSWTDPFEYDNRQRRWNQPLYSCGASSVERVNSGNEIEVTESRNSQAACLKGPTGMHSNSHRGGMAVASVDSDSLNTQKLFYSMSGRYRSMRLPFGEQQPFSPLDLRFHHSASWESPSLCQLGSLPTESNNDSSGSIGPCGDRKSSVSDDPIDIEECDLHAVIKTWSPPHDTTSSFLSSWASNRGPNQIDEARVPALKLLDWRFQPRRPVESVTLHPKEFVASARNTDCNNESPPEAYRRSVAHSDTVQKKESSSFSHSSTPADPSVDHEDINTEQFADWKTNARTSIDSSNVDRQSCDLSVGEKRKPKKKGKGTLSVSYGGNRRTSGPATKNRTITVEHKLSDRHRAAQWHSQNVNGCDHDDVPYLLDAQNAQLKRHVDQTEQSVPLSVEETQSVSSSVTVSGLVDTIPARSRNRHPNKKKLSATPYRLSACGDSHESGSDLLLTIVYQDTPKTMIENDQHTSNSVDRKSVDTTVRMMIPNQSLRTEQSSISLTVPVSTPPTPSVLELSGKLNETHDVKVAYPSQKRNRKTRMKSAPACANTEIRPRRLSSSRKQQDGLAQRLQVWESPRPVLGASGIGKVEIAEIALPCSSNDNVVSISAQSELRNLELTSTSSSAQRKKPTDFSLKLINARDTKLKSSKIASPKTQAISYHLSKTIQPINPRTKDIQSKKDLQSKKDMQSKEDMQSKKHMQRKRDMQSKKYVPSKKDIQSKKDMQNKKDSKQIMEMFASPLHDCQHEYSPGVKQLSASVQDPQADNAQVSMSSSFVSQREPNEQTSSSSSSSSLSSSSLFSSSSSTSSSSSSSSARASLVCISSCNPGIIDYCPTPPDVAFTYTAAPSSLTLVEPSPLRLWESGQPNGKAEGGKEKGREEGGGPRSLPSALTTLTLSIPKITHDSPNVSLSRLAVDPIRYMHLSTSSLTLSGNGTALYPRRKDERICGMGSPKGSMTERLPRNADIPPLIARVCYEAEDPDAKSRTLDSTTKLRGRYDFSSSRPMAPSASLQSARSASPNRSTTGCERSRFCRNSFTQTRHGSLLLHHNPLYTVSQQQWKSLHCPKPLSTAQNTFKSPPFELNLLSNNRIAGTDSFNHPFGSLTDRQQTSARWNVPAADISSGNGDDAVVLSSGMSSPKSLQGKRSHHRCSRTVCGFLRRSVHLADCPKQIQQALCNL